MKTTNKLSEFKSILRMNDVSGDPWGVCMGAFFDCAAHLYEKGDCPSEWGYNVGWGGNHVDQDSPFFELFYSCSDIELIEIGNYLLRITDILRFKGRNY